MVKQVLHIRRAVADDAKLIAELSAVTFFDTFKATCTDDDMQGFIEQHFNEKQVFKELSNANDFYFIAFTNGNPAGYIRMKEEVSDVEIINKHRGIELKRIGLSI